MKPTNRSAFTLVELLVVIAIIAILAALLLPVLGKAKRSGDRTVCINRSHQWGVGMESFLAENDQLVPRENAVPSINDWTVVAALTNDNVWYNALPPYVGIQPASSYVNGGADVMGFYQRQSMFHCPAARFTVSPEVYPQFSVAMNSKLMSGTNGVKSSSILEPERTPFFVEAGVRGETKAHPLQSTYNGQPHIYASRFSARHDGRGTLSFADGHTDVLPVNKVVDTAPGSQTAGRAIFPSGDVNWCSDPSLDPNL